MTTLPVSVKHNDAQGIWKTLPIKLFHPKKITDSLQGSIWRATTRKEKSPKSRTVVVKLTDRHQHNSSTVIVKNVLYHKTLENIVSEQGILKHLTQQKDCSPFITKFFSFLQTEEFFVLIQEDGGYPLFDFIQTAHALIMRKKIDIPHWKKVVKVIFKQLVESIAYIHSKNVCHHDISIENFLINDIGIDVDEKEKIKFKTDDIRVKLCDFGLAELYANDACLSNKHCGKTPYKSPEVIQLKRSYNGKMNDVWGIGVCLFMLSFGCHPFLAAIDTDQAYKSIMCGHIFDVLLSWDLLSYIDSYSIDLFDLIFKYEKDRITVSELKQHSFITGKNLKK